MPRSAGAYTFLLILPFILPLLIRQFVLATVQKKQSAAARTSLQILFFYSDTVKK